MFSTLKNKNLSLEQRFSVEATTIESATFPYKNYLSTTNGEKN